MLGYLALVGLVPLGALADRPLAAMPLREQTVDGVMSFPFIGIENTSPVPPILSALHARQAGVCGPGKTACNGGCIPSSSKCCPGSGYCDAEQYCTVRGTCCPNGKTCLPATVCGVGMQLCNAACMPEGAVCCTGGGYCESGRACLANNKCGPGNGVASSAVSSAISPVGSGIAVTASIPITSATWAATTAVAGTWSSGGVADPDAATAVPTTSLASVAPVSSPAVSVPVSSSVGASVQSASTTAFATVNQGARQLSLDSAVSSALFVVGVVHAVIPFFR